MRHISRGGDDVITVDGPRGPNRIVKPGAAFLAEQSKAELIFIRIIYHKHIKLFWRWDKYEVPLPFSKVTVECGQKLSI